MLVGWAEALVKIARMTLTIKLDRNWSSFQLANNTPPLSVTGSVIAPSARIDGFAVFTAEVESGTAGARLHASRRAIRRRARRSFKHFNPRKSSPFCSAAACLPQIGFKRLPWCQMV